MSITKGLIIKKKWLDLILSGQKIWEIRNGPLKIRGAIFLIQSGSGMVIGKVDIVDCIKLTEELFYKNTDMHRIYGSYDSIGYSHPYAWVIKENTAQRFKEPIPYKHPLGAVIWVNLDSCCDTKKLLAL